MPYPDPEPNDRRADKYPPYASSYQPPAAEMEVDAGDSHEPWPPHHSLIQQIAEMSVVSDPEEEQLGEAPSHEQQPSTSVSSGCSSRMENGVSAVPTPEEMTGAERDAVRDWCEGCGRYDRCGCPMFEAVMFKEPPPVCPVMRAPPKKAPPPSKELSPRTRSVPVLPETPPPPPPKWMATGACQCYMCKKPIAVVEPAVKNRRITVVEPGDLNYATDGVPWSVCSRCGVFRPFANATEESCLNVIGIECTYGESEWEAQQQEPARGSTE